MSYADWNEAIGRYFFRPQYAGQTVVLAVNADTLQACWQEYRPRSGFGSAEAAKDDFVMCVLEELEERATHDRDDHWRCDEVGGERYPIQLGLLAFQVLAAMEEADDSETTWHTRYWPCLQQLLGQEIQAGKPPEGLKHETHEELWEYLAEWVNETNHGRLGRVSLPTGNEGEMWRYIRLPLSQALLSHRQRAELLPIVFSGLGLKHGNVLDPSDIEGWVREPQVPDRVRRILKDSTRCNQAIVQIQEAFRNWDGTANPAKNINRTPPEKRRHDCELEISDPKHGLAFYGVAFAQGGGYRRQELSPEVVAKLCGHFHDPQELVDGTGLFFQPTRGAVVAVWHESLGRYRTGRKPRIGDRVLLLCTKVNYEQKNLHQHGSQAWERKLTEVADKKTIQRYRPVGGVNESGWKQLEGIPDNHVLVVFTIGDWVPGTIWQKVIDASRRPLRIQGGLRLRRTRWMEGAGPVVELIDKSATSVVCDAHPLQIGRPHFLDTRGAHLVTGDYSSGPPFKTVRVRIDRAQFSRPVEREFMCGWRRANDGRWLSVFDVTNAVHSLRGIILDGPPLPEWESASVEPHLVKRGEQGGQPRVMAVARSLEVWRSLAPKSREQERVLQLVSPLSRLQLGRARGREARVPGAR